jgi:hypothetical protein
MGRELRTGDDEWQWWRVASAIARPRWIHRVADRHRRACSTPGSVERIPAHPPAAAYGSAAIPRGRASGDALMASMAFRRWVTVWRLFLAELKKVAFSSTRRYRDRGETTAPGHVAFCPVQPQTESDGSPN